MISRSACPPNSSPTQYRAKSENSAGNSSNSASPGASLRYSDGAGSNGTGINRPVGVSPTGIAVGDISPSVLMPGQADSTSPPAVSSSSAKIRKCRLHLFTEHRLCEATIHPYLQIIKQVYVSLLRLTHSPPGDANPVCCAYWACCIESERWWCRDRMSGGCPARASRRP